jgi:hypothetical protein
MMNARNHLDQMQRSNNGRYRCARLDDHCGQIVTTLAQGQCLDGYQHEITLGRVTRELLPLKPGGSNGFNGAVYRVKGTSFQV